MFPSINTQSSTKPDEKPEINNIAKPVQKNETPVTAESNVNLEANDTANISPESTKKGTKPLVDIDIDALCEDEQFHKTELRAENVYFSGNYDQKVINELKNFLVNISDDKTRNKLQEKIEHLESKYAKKGDVGYRSWTSLMHAFNYVTADKLKEKESIEKLNSLKVDVINWVHINRNDNVLENKGLDEKINNYELGRNQIINRISSMGFTLDQIDELMVNIPSVQFIISHNGTTASNFDSKIFENINALLDEVKGKDVKDTSVYDNLGHKMAFYSNLNEVALKVSEMGDTRETLITTSGNYLARKLNVGSVVTDSKKREMLGLSLSIESNLDMVIMGASGQKLKEIKKLREEMDFFVRQFSFSDSNIMTKAHLEHLSKLALKIKEKLGDSLSLEDRQNLTNISNISLELVKARTTLTDTNKEVTQKIVDMKQSLESFKAEILSLPIEDRKTLYPAMDVLGMISNLMDDSINCNNPYLAMAAQVTMENYLTELKNFKELSKMVPRDEKLLQKSLKNMEEISNKLVAIIDKTNNYKADGLTVEESKEILADVETLVGKEKMEVINAQVQAKIIEQEDSENNTETGSKIKKIKVVAPEFIFINGVKSSNIDLVEFSETINKDNNEMEKPEFANKMADTIIKNPGLETSIDDLNVKMKNINKAEAELVVNYKTFQNIQKKLENLLLSDAFKRLLDDMKKVEESLEKEIIAAYLEKMINDLINNADLMQDLMKLEVDPGQQDPMVNLLVTLRKIIKAQDIDTKAIYDKSDESKMIQTSNMNKIKESKELSDKIKQIHNGLIQTILEFSERYQVSRNMVDKLKQKNLI